MKGKPFKRNWLGIKSWLTYLLKLSAERFRRLLALRHPKGEVNG
jgi:hypothetical protein